ncbi:uncharacterized protein LOC134727799 [Mytilus trossulus]|uniref:uncharacterized protein LOC134727799 n=1 Tax=Mytilus trossulus TaxID=6551 RepID=UPI003003CEB0
MVEEQTTQEDFRPVPFCCKKSRGQTLDRIKAFKRFLQEPDTAINDNDITEVFSSQVVMDTVPEKIGHLFYSLKYATTKFINQTFFYTPCNEIAEGIMLLTCHMCQSVRLLVLQSCFLV